MIQLPGSGRLLQMRLCRSLWVVWDSWQLVWIQKKWFWFWTDLSISFVQYADVSWNENLYDQARLRTQSLGVRTELRFRWIRQRTQLITRKTKRGLTRKAEASLVKVCHIFKWPRALPIFVTNLKDLAAAVCFFYELLCLSEIVFSSIPKLNRDIGNLKLVIKVLLINVSIFFICQ